MNPNSEIVTAFGNPLRYIQINESDDCLDMGCGGGDNCYRLAEMTKGNVAGIDAQQKMLDYAERNNNKSIQFLLGDLIHCPFPDNSFNKIISNAAFFHVEDKASVLKEAYRLLRKGGSFCFADVTIRRNIPNTIFHAIDSSEWIELLQSSPFHFSGGSYFISEEAVFLNGKYINMYISTFLAKK